MLIVGCGDLGGRIARRARARGEPVSCLVGSDQSAECLTGEGLSASAVDLDNQTPDLGDDRAQRQIYFFAPPPASGRQDPRMRRFLTALGTDTLARIVYVSTTGVYGNCAGEWVDENRPANPQVDRAKRRHDAERQLMAWHDASSGEVIILRVAGIYGPDKMPLARLRNQTPMVAEADAPWTNRIHIDDLVTVCEAAMDRGRDGEIYNVSDGEPGNMRDYFDRVAKLYGLPLAPVLSLDEAQQQLSPGLLSYLGESRRLSNRKMLEQLQLELRYPTLAEGLTACHQAENAHG